MLRFTIRCNCKGIMSENNLPNHPCARGAHFQHRLEHHHAQGFHFSYLNSSYLTFWAVEAERSSNNNPKKKQPRANKTGISDRPEELIIGIRIGSWWGGTRAKNNFSYISILHHSSVLRAQFPRASFGRLSGHGKIWYVCHVCSTKSSVWRAFQCLSPFQCLFCRFFFY